MDCAFCRIVGGKVPAYRVWEDGDFLAFLDTRPINPGHLLLVPRKHVDYVFDLPSTLYHGLFSAAKKLAPVLKVLTEAERVGVALEGFGVPHVHLHLVPLYHANELNPERARSASDGELLALQQRFSPRFKDVA
jgi:histidine triad (HIT) family protein